MNTRVEFKSAAFPKYPNEDAELVNSNCWGTRMSHVICLLARAGGFATRRGVDWLAEASAEARRHGLRKKGKLRGAEYHKPPQGDGNSNSFAGSGFTHSQTSPILIEPVLSSVLSFHIAMTFFLGNQGSGGEGS